MMKSMEDLWAFRLSEMLERMRISSNEEYKDVVGTSVANNKKCKVVLWWRMCMEIGWTYLRALITVWFDDENTHRYTVEISETTNEYFEMAEW